MELNTDLPCSMQSAAAREPLAGTAASQVEHWLIVEVPGVWERKVLDCPALSEVRPVLESWECEQPRLRLQLVRRPEQPVVRRALQVFVATVDLQRRRVLQGTLDSLSDLAAWDLPAILEGGTGPALVERSEPLFLVCGHGRRDRCCARLGTPLYQRLRERLPEQTWLTSHTGGHRFAPTLVHLPSGLCYGRLDVEECDALVEASQSGRVHDLDRLRGRCCLPAPAQWAEIHLRRLQPELRLRSWQLEEVDAETVEVRFDTEDGPSQALRLRRETLSEAPQIEQSCLSGKLRPVQRWIPVDAPEDSNASA